MKTFCAVDDAALIQLLGQARRRIVFIAPGLNLPVAHALGQRFDEIDDLDVTVVLDPDEDVCRIGYGEVAALQHLHALAQRQGFWLKSQPGLRVGVLLADEQTLVWSPTARSVEEQPSSSPTAGADLLEEPAPLAPNGLMLGADPGEQLAHAVAAEGTDSGPDQAEIGRSAITPEQVKATVQAHQDNPPIPVDLAQVTRVFSSKLQFVELKVTRAKLSKSQLKVPNHLLNVDVSGDLKGLIESKLHAFADLRDEPVEVPAFVNGNAACDAHNEPLMEHVSESSLERKRHDLEKHFVYDIAKFGRLIEKARKTEFAHQLEAYKTQLLSHSEAVRKLLNDKAEQILDEAVDLIMARSTMAQAKPGEKPQTLNAQAIREELSKGLERAKGEAPTLALVYKDVTYEQTQSADFRAKVSKALPAPVRKRLGDWTEKFSAARERPGAP
ncbi:MAG: hypothetical protein QUV35_08110 [Hydrogenophaga sp.]|uniref:hypothetical protein n=1 Tax=Hydrogenophaga sp. TaxID=1904254 RepID=UPI0026195ABA|nr:hypothetical protein [Hydrogenophaga sp.]MDM7942578.1 hypothetical protein [Hydrogenophaga sp.]